VNPLGGLFGDRAELSVETDRAEYLPGDSVQVSASVEGREELEIEEARVELVYENEYTYTERSTSGRGTTSTHDVTTTDREVQASARILEARTIRPGERLEERAALTVPAAAVPSGEGELTSVRWKVSLVLGRRHALDPDAEARIAVLSPPGADAAAPQTPPDLDKPDDWELELRLAGGRAVRSGETVRGTLVVTPGEEAEPQELRVELVRREEVTRGEGKTSETVAAAARLAEKPSLGARIPTGLDFALPVPATACPTLRTGTSSVRWYVRGVVARRLRSDYNVVEEIAVSSSGAPAGPL
jgi:arrestin (S-antigen)-like protein